MTIDFQDAIVHHARKAKAERLAASLEADYPAISIHPEIHDRAIVAWSFHHTDGEDVFRFLTTETDAVPELLDVVEACEAEGLDPELGYEEEDGRSGSVVDQLYRAQYREASSTKQSCGDWLAEWLTRYLNADKKLDLDAFEACLSANGVDLTAKWARVKGSSSNGWQGRFRMNGRQVLEKRVALTEKVYDDTGAEHDVPAEEVARLQSKHSKWLAKERKAIEAADALAA